MCGGSGTRFWPASRKKTPKQFLRMNETSSLIQETVRRLEGLIPKERVFLLAAEAHKEYLERHLPEIPADNYILEPGARNTGPALALAARRLESIAPDLIMAALPADHAIKDVKGFVTLWLSLLNTQRQMTVLLPSALSQMLLKPATDTLSWEKTSLKRLKMLSSL